MKICLDLSILTDHHLRDYIADERLVPAAAVRHVVAHFVEGFRNGLYVLSASSRFRINAAFEKPQRVEALLERDWEDAAAWKAQGLTADQRTAFFGWLRRECLIYLSHAIAHDDPPSSTDV